MDRRGAAYQGAVKTFSAAFVAIRLLLLVVSLANGGGPLAIGFLLGLAFVAVGVLRLWLVTRSGR